VRHAVYRLDEKSRPALVAHFVTLSATDRRLRFGKTLAPEVIAAYVDRINLGCDAVFAVRDAEHLLVGAMHVAISDDHAELGLSVLPAQRRRGIGQALVERAVSHARKCCVPEILLHCAADNMPILRLARKCGMDIAARGGEAIAHLGVASIAPERAPAASVSGYSK
jgi:GNAT superfamily N-acetyltransferase